MMSLHVGKPVGNADLDAVREVAATMPFGAEDVIIETLRQSTYQENASRTLSEIAAELKRRAEALAAGGMTPGIVGVWRAWAELQCDKRACAHERSGDGAEPVQ